MNRRSFLGSILALGAAPAIVRADSLMRIVPRAALILPPVEILRYPAADWPVVASCFVSTGGQTGWARISRRFKAGEEIVLTVPPWLKADRGQHENWRWGAQIETMQVFSPYLPSGYIEVDRALPDDLLRLITQ